MKERSKVHCKLKETGVSPQEAIRRLVACQLSGHLQGSSVIVEADASTAQLLSAACLGRSHKKTQQVVQAVGGSAEQIGRAASHSTAASEVRLDKPATPSSKEDLDKDLEKPPAWKGEGGLAAEALGNAAFWGATCEIGKLGSMPILLPAVQAANVDSHPGIALSRPLEENLRLRVPDSCSAEERQQQKGVSRQQKQETRREKHAKRSQSVQRELESSPKVWLLSLEEAFFMHYALECLTIAGSAGPCSSQGLWEQCMRLKQGFVNAYLPFHHFRSKGWVVRPGSEYGVDYVLYDGHPSIVHSSYCVLALTGSKCPGVLQWTDIEAASRVCSEVLKKLVLLYVCEVPDVPINTIEYLSAVTVEERLVQRWFSGKA